MWSDYKIIEMAVPVMTPVQMGALLEEGYAFSVHVCVSLGELPDDHGLTLEEIDFVRRAQADIPLKTWYYVDDPFFYSYGDSGWIWRFYEPLQSI